MHARTLVELAGLLVHHAPAWLALPAPLPQATLERYWVGSKVRLDVWCQELKSASLQPAPRHTPSSRTAGILAEILASEVLTRVWTGLATLVDRRLACGDYEPVVRSVLIGHLEARHRALRLLLDAHGLRPADVQPLDRLRREAERWTDLLIALLSLDDTLGVVQPLSIDAARAQQFAQDLHVDRRLGRLDLVRGLWLASLRTGAKALDHWPTVHPRLHEEIGAALLAAFPAENFDATGLLRSAWLARLEAGAHDSQVLLDDYLGEVAPTSPQRSFPPADHEPPQRRFPP